MEKIKEKRTKTKISLMNIFIKIMAGLLALFMLLYVSITLIYYLINM